MTALLQAQKKNRQEIAHANALYYATSEQSHVNSKRKEQLQ